MAGKLFFTMLKASPFLFLTVLEVGCTLQKVTKVKSGNVGSLAGGTMLILEGVGELFLNFISLHDSTKFMELLKVFEKKMFKFRNKRCPLLSSAL